MIICG